MSILAPDSLVAAGWVVEVAWPTDPGSGDTPTWTSITPWVRGLSIKRGRQYELDRVEAGTLSAELNNLDGRFDPTNTSSPYYPYVLPLRMIRVRSSYDAVDYPLFFGYVERWPMRWEAAVAGRTDLEAVDGFAVLAQRTLRGVVEEEQLSNSPLAVFPMEEGSGSASAGSIVGSWPAATVVDSKYGAGAVAFGEEALTVDGGAAAKISGGDGSSTAGAGSAIELTNPTNGGPFVTCSGGFAVEVWFKAGSVGASQLWTIFAQMNSTNALPQIELRLDDTGEVLFSINSDAGVVAASGTLGSGLDDGTVHQVVLTLNSAGTLATMWLDGSSSASDLVSGTLPSATTGLWATLGGRRSPLVASQFAGDLTVSHVALYDGGGLTSTPVAELYEAGASGFSGERTDERLTRVLEYAGWLGGSDLDTGNSTMSGATLAGRNALEVVQEVADAESGNVYVDGDGQVVFKSRQARYNQAVSAVFNDPPGSDLPYAPDSNFDFDLTRVFNRVVVAPPATGAATREDATSQQRYLVRVLEEQPPIDSPSEAVDRADYRLARFKDPHLRLPSLTVQPRRTGALWPVALGADFGDRFRVTRDPRDAPSITTDVLVEAVEHQASPDDWVTTWALSPAGIESYFKVEDATYGYVDTGGIVVAY